MTPTPGASVDMTKRVSYIRGWALIHPKKATPEPEFIVADTLARVILNTTDDAVARNQVPMSAKEGVKYKLNGAPLSGNPLVKANTRNGQIGFVLAPGSYTFDIQLRSILETSVW